MWAIDPDEFQSQADEIEKLVFQNDDLQAALTATQGQMESKTNTITAAAGSLVAIKTRMDGLPLCDLPALTTEISGITQDMDVVLKALQQEVLSCT